MPPLTSVLAFAVAAAVLTLTPGADTMLVLRTAIVGGRGPGVLAGLGAARSPRAGRTSAGC